MAEFNKLESIADDFVKNRRFDSAIKIYLYMADGDTSLDGGYLGEKLGQCYELCGDLNAAKYWYGRAVEENPEVRLYSVEGRRRLDNIGIDDIVDCD